MVRKWLSLQYCKISWWLAWSVFKLGSRCWSYLRHNVSKIVFPFYKIKGLVLHNFIISCAMTKTNIRGLSVGRNIQGGATICWKEFYKKILTYTCPIDGLNVISIGISYMFKQPWKGISCLPFLNQWQNDKSMKNFNIYRIRWDKMIYTKYS